MNYSLVLWVKIWQIFIPGRLELLKTHHCALYYQCRRPCIALFKFKVEYRVKDKIILLQVVQTNMSPALTNNDLIVPNLPANGKKMIDTVIDIDVDSAYK